MKKLSAGLLIFFVLNTAVGFQTRNEYVDSYLQQFLTNPKNVVDEPSAKFNAKGEPVKDPALFNFASILSGQFVHIKQRSRANVCRMEFGKKVCVGESQYSFDGSSDSSSDISSDGSSAHIFSEVQPNDFASELVDPRVTLITTLQEMEAKKLTHGSVETAPWSDDYWGLNNGVLGARYADPEFNRQSYKWQSRAEYSLNTMPASKLISTKQEEGIKMLSPSEKYDLLIGDSRYNLTVAQWRDGAQYVKNGEVESWMGICHGWAAASFMMPRPLHRVDLLAADGKSKIPFYPSDIRALGSLLWAKASVTSRYVGGRCNLKKPERDPETGRIISQDCFDNNPATWHEVVVNQIGQAKESFVMDATYDYEVWNHPLKSYSYNYFNPVTGQQVEKLEQATVELEKYPSDRFKKYRSPNAKWIVGVAMDVTYLSETAPVQKEAASETDDYRKTVTYMYDLELDANQKIIGGEWYSNLHPDFLWAPEVGAVAMAPGDPYVQGGWTSGLIPSSWRNIGAQNSVNGLPLGKIVYPLFEMSTK